MAFGGSASRLKYNCVVPSCKKEIRADHLKEHYRSVVKFDPDGEPINENNPDFKQLSQVRKQHTLYFRRHGFSKDNLPITKSTVASCATSTNPFLIAQRVFEKKKALEVEKPASDIESSCDSEESSDDDDDVKETDSENNEKDQDKDCRPTGQFANMPDVTENNGNNSFDSNVNDNIEEENKTESIINDKKETVNVNPHQHQ